MLALTRHLFVPLCIGLAATVLFFVGVAAVILYG